MKKTSPIYYNLNTGELDDKRILAALDEAYKDYIDGAIIECRDILREIVYSIDCFSDDYRL